MGFGIHSKIKRWFMKFLLCEIHSNVPKSCGCPHLIGVVINKYAKIGENCIIFHNVTIGGKANGVHEVPIIGNDCIIYANCVIFGKISLGSNSIVGGGSVVTKSFPKNSILAGNPAKIIGKVPNNIKAKDFYQSKLDN